MTMHLDTVFKQGVSYPLVSLPKQFSSAFDSIPNLALGDVFKYDGTSVSGGLNVIHQKTGIKVIMHPARLLESDRFYHTTLRSINKTALLVNYSATVFTNTHKKVVLEAGTIFDSYTKVQDFYIVNLPNGEECRIYKSIVATLVDRNVVQDEEEKPIVYKATSLPSSNQLVLKRSVSINGIEFSSSEAADTAEKFVLTVDQLIKDMGGDENDIKGALALATSLKVIKP